MMARTLGVLFLSAIVLSTSIASAQTGEERGRAYYERATEAFEGADWLNAAELFQRAHALSGHAELLYNIGLSYERALDEEAALAAYERYLEESDDDGRMRSEAQTRVRTLRTRADAGDLRVPVLEEHPHPPAPEAQRPSTLAIALGVVGAVSLAGSGAALAMRLSERADLDAACPAGECAPSEHARVDRFERAGIVAWLLGGVGVGAVSGAIIAAVRHRRAPAEGDVDIAVGLGTVSLTGAF